MSHRAIEHGLLLAVTILLIAATACENSETVAPEGSTINLTASPAQIVLSGTPPVQAAPVTLVATVRDKLGVPLEGQDVRFETTSGSLSPSSATPVSTDEHGNALSTLTGATTGPTVTVTSGKATDMLTLNAASAEIAQILLSPNSTNLTNCNTPIDLIATVLDSDSMPVDGVSIEFVFTDPSNTALLTGTFNPSPALTDAIGEAMTTLTVDSNLCGQRCTTAQKTCTTTVRAQTVGGGITSANVTTITDQM